uniref:Uncharacterized protein n=1 Tax=Anguilla anguilla TaxID=7936 RepID=A0A0E9SQ17_ANGAN
MHTSLNGASFLNRLSDFSSAFWLFGTSTCHSDLVIGAWGFWYLSHLVRDLYCDPYLIGYSMLMRAQTYLKQIHSAPNQNIPLHIQ